MLTLIIEDQELYSDEQGFITVKGGKLLMEHSLIAVSKWESIYKRSFVLHPPNTPKERTDYFACMLINSDAAPLVQYLNGSQVQEIIEYIGDLKTATHLRERPGGTGGRDVVTSELIYYWMINYGIPFECQKWHFSRLLALIKIAQVKNGNASPISKKDMAAQNRALNAARLKKLNTRG